MNCLKTSFTIAILACFLTVKTNAQVGLSANNLRQSVVIKYKKKYFPNTAPDLKLPKYSNPLGWFKLVPDYFGDPCFDAIEVQDRYHQSIITQNRFMNRDIRSNALNAIISRDATLLERVVGTTLLLFTN